MSASLDKERARFSRTRCTAHGNIVFMIRSLKNFCQYFLATKKSSLYAGKRVNESREKSQNTKAPPHTQEN